MDIASSYDISARPALKALKVVSEALVPSAQPAYQSGFVRWETELSEFSLMTDLS